MRECRKAQVLSPLLANVYLNYVMDQWFGREVIPRLSGAATLVRYADDFICTFEFERDARRFQEVLKKRLGRYSLELAEDKTKLRGLVAMLNVIQSDSMVVKVLAYSTS